MQMNFVKSALVAAMLGLGAMSAAPANAGTVDLTVKVGSHIDRHGPSWKKGRDWNRGHRGPRFVCQPHEAIWKASRMGMHRPGIQRVRANQIVVAGRHHGHYATVVFDRTSRNCRVIARRGI